MSDILKVRGVRRFNGQHDPGSEAKLLIVAFNHAPTGEDMDEFIAYALAFRTAKDAGRGPKRKR
jgi:hypothetical protein